MNSGVEAPAVTPTEENFSKSS
mgnify:CR=1